jgi:hypothetical protein
VFDKASKGNLKMGRGYWPDSIFWRIDLVPALLKGLTVHLRGSFGEPCHHCRQMLPLRLPTPFQTTVNGGKSDGPASTNSPLSLSFALSRFTFSKTFLLATVSKLVVSLLHVSSSPSIVSELRPVRYCAFSASLWHYRLQGLSKSF